jgi:hypothetical protein
MLKTIGVASTDQLIDETIPSHIRLKERMKLPDDMGEMELLAMLKEISEKNIINKNFIGIRTNNTTAVTFNSNGNLFLGTFSENGPLKCSGLEIKQYSELKLEAVFGSEFNKVKSFEEDHQTPFETIQNFIFINFKKL